MREGAFIVLYGLFGVPAEVALLVSFLNLAGILLNNVIGAGVIAFHREDPAVVRRAVRVDDQTTGGG